MAYRSILVHLDQTARSLDRFELALDLASQQDAGINAYYATSMPYLVQQVEKHHTEVLTECRERARRAGIPFFWVAEAEDMVHESLIARLNYQAFCADLIIIGQPGASAGSLSATPRDLPTRLVLTSGRPILTIPFAGTFSKIGSRAMIAWRSGRASARAVEDAIPLLCQADAVFLLSFATSNTEVSQHQDTLKKLAGYLAHHNIKAVTEVRLIKGISFGDALLNRAAEEGIDLLVAGGALPTAPAPLAEHLIREMTIPVLMSS
jgi:nucleotide-binding universal stress UspA family protein